METKQQNCSPNCTCESYKSLHRDYCKKYYVIHKDRYVNGYKNKHPLAGVPKSYIEKNYYKLDLIFRCLTIMTKTRKKPNQIKKIISSLKKFIPSINFIF